MASFKQPGSMNPKEGEIETCSPISCNNPLAALRLGSELQIFNKKLKRAPIRKESIRFNGKLKLLILFGCLAITCQMQHQLEMVLLFAFISISLRCQELQFEGYIALHVCLE